VVKLIGIDFLEHCQLLRESNRHIGEDRIRPWIISFDIL